MTNDDPDLGPLPPDAAPALLAERLRLAGRRGLFRHAIAPDAGGHGDRFADLIGAHRRLGEQTRDPGLMLAINAHIWGTLFPLLRHGSPTQQAVWLAALLTGECLGGHAITEPDCGSDLQALAVEAIRDGHGFRLNGEKRYITNVPAADLLVVYARLDGVVSPFLLERSDPGFEQSAEHKVDACRGSLIGCVRLNDCRIPVERLLGRPGAGERIVQQALEFERAFVFAGMAGAMQAQLDAVVAHSRTRHVGGRHLGRHQAIAHRIADMKLRLDTLDLWLQRCAELADGGRRLSLAAAQTKLYGAEAFLQSSLDAVQICGALGLEPESGLVGLVRDALASRLFSGSSEIQKNIIAALLGTGDGYRSEPRRVSP